MNTIPFCFYWLSILLFKKIKHISDFIIYYIKKELTPLHCCQFFYGTKSLIIGIPVGRILSYIIYKVLMSGNVIIAYRLPIVAIIISALAVFVLITTIMKYSIDKINKQNIIDTIRNDNI